MNIQYVYTLNKRYIGRSIDPWKRYNQHIRGEVKSTRDWITNSKKLPKLVVLAKYDHNVIWQNNGHNYCYEQVCVVAALKANWDLLYADLGWPPSREQCIKAGKASMFEKLLDGRSKHAVENSKKLVQWIKGHPKQAYESGIRANKATVQWSKNHPKKASQRSAKAGKTVMAEKLSSGKSKHAVKMGKAAMAEKLSNGKSKTAVYCAHIRWHINRKIINPNCPFCIGAVQK